MSIALASAGWSVALVDRTVVPDLRVGETLAAEIREPLAALGAWEPFLATGPLATTGICSAWGASEVRTHEPLLHPYGGAWHVDRAALERMLRQRARAVGVRLLERTALVGVLDAPGGIRLQCLSRALPSVIDASFAVDATGRARALARRLGSRSRRLDQLVACHWHGLRTDSSPPFALIESSADGWWYSAVLPDSRTITTFMTDVDLLPAPSGRAHSLIGKSPPRTRDYVVTWFGGSAAPAPRVVLADTSSTRPFGGERWVAVGDAAVAVDPLSGQGVNRALRSGLKAASAIAAHLSGDAEPLARYVQALEFSRREQQAVQRSIYAKELRWSQAPFWSRRLASQASAHRP